MIFTKLLSDYGHYISRMLSFAWPIFILLILPENLNDKFIISFFLITLAVAGPYSYILTRNKQISISLSHWIIPILVGISFGYILKFEINYFFPLFLSIITMLSAELFAKFYRSRNNHVIASFLRDHLFKLSVFLVIIIFNTIHSEMIFIISSLFTILIFILVSKKPKLKFEKIYLKNTITDFIFYFNSYWITIIFLLVFNSEINIFFALIIERCLRVVSVLVSQYSLRIQGEKIKIKLLNNFKNICLIFLTVSIIYYLFNKSIESEYILTLISLNIISSLHSLIGYTIKRNYHNLRFILVFLAILSYLLSDNFLFNIGFIFLILIFEYYFINTELKILNKLYSIKT